MNHNRRAFTLTELLVALGIIGAIAALSIPSLLNNINARMLTTQLKSTVGSIQQLATDQLVSKKTKDLSDTDFKTEASLMVDKNFSIVKKCDTAAECWDQTYKRLSDMAVLNRIPGKEEGEMTTVKLKNGVLLSYKVVASGRFGDDDSSMGLFYVDVNGAEKPNILGRDYFVFYVTKKGRIVDNWVINRQDPEEDEILGKCKNAGVMTGCLTYIQIKNWTMDY